MPLLPESLDYTARDFDSIRARLIQLLQSVFPEWSDFEVASFGNLLLEMYAFVGDVLTFYQDSLARESRLVTATQRRNVIALASMLGYRLHGGRAATAEVVFRLESPLEASVTIAAGTTVRTREVTEPVRYQLLRDVVIDAGELAGVGVVEHSRSHFRLFDARGRSGLEVRLDYRPYLDDSVRISSPSGQFSEVRSFLSSGPNDRHFVVLVDDEDRATLRFGDGVNAVRPSGTLSISYKTGGGPTGNVDPGRIVVLEGGLSDAFGNPAPLTVTNPARASGGIERQSIASARLLAPETLRAPARCVSREDFEINARRLPEVARALMLTSNEDASIEENSGILFVVPQGGGVPTGELKAQVLRQVTEVYPCTLTFRVRVQDPVYRRVNVAAIVFLLPGATPRDVRTRIQTALSEFFRITLPDQTPNRLVDFGFNIKDAIGDPDGEVAWSDVLNVVRDVPGVRKVGDGSMGFTLNGSPMGVSLEVREFPVLGDVTLVDGNTGAPL